MGAFEHVSGSCLATARVHVVIARPRALSESMARPQARSSPRAALVMASTSVACRTPSAIWARASPSSIPRCFSDARQSASPPECSC
jgi:hypothetical protein